MVGVSVMSLRAREPINQVFKGTKSQTEAFSNWQKMSGKAENGRQSFPDHNCMHARKLPKSASAHSKLTKLSSKDKVLL